MPSLFHFFVFSLTLATVSGQCYYNSTPTPRSNQQCSWYNRATCCQQASISSFRSDPLSLECGEPVRSCAEHMVSLLCGFSCSPRFGLYLNETSGRVKVCHNWAFKMWYDCKQAFVKTETSVGNINFGACHRISDKYSNEYDFFINGFNMDVAGPHALAGKECFNSAPLLSFSLLSIALAFAFIL
ncbi:hypothetical protein PROFUN_05549 [Planoprotostelium fungivorum]|uniref:Folate receptor-like domain-containing protein n=1 Tax=Planoprotostelium fungivorum TaxID=1890364 RepID=A0A2P6N040_9EUKA|nr:hypothetical protein PROFUN_05549 [Planoprotostelium fungivorum]